MRLVILLATAFIGATTLYSQSPSTVPLVLRPMFAASDAGMHAALAPMPKFVVAAAASTNIPAIGLLAAGVAGILALLLLAVVFLRRRNAGETASPIWIATARATVPESRTPREHGRECDELEKALVPDIRTIGVAALGRAHQLDLYSRLVARSKRVQAGRASGAEFTEFSRATLATLRAVAPSPAAMAKGTAYRQVRPALSVLAREDAVAIRAFYDGLDAKRREQDAAWKEAREAIEARPADQQKCLAAMERLRQLYRGTASEAAALVGDIEISVRAAV